MLTLQEFFTEHPKVALAFSGGADSAYLLYEAQNCGADVHPYFVKTQFQPQFEDDDAHRLCSQLGIKLTTIDVNILSVPEVVRNPSNRCYYCKSAIFTAIKAQAGTDGYDIVIDGTNASDLVNDRPGMRALQELAVLSPLRICGITKDELRKLSGKAGLFTAHKPAYACLATRIPTGTTICNEDLVRIEESENILFRLGYTDFRIRLRDDKALLQLTPEQRLRAIDEKALLDELLSGMFLKVDIDEKTR